MGVAAGAGAGLDSPAAGRAGSEKSGTEGVDEGLCSGTGAKAGDEKAETAAGTAAGGVPKAERREAVGCLVSGRTGGVEKAGSWEAAGPNAPCPSNCALLNPDSVAGGVLRSAPVGLDDEANGSKGLCTTPRDEVGGEGGAADCGAPKGEVPPAKGLNAPVSGCSGAEAGAGAREVAWTGAGTGAGLISAVPGGGLPKAENAGISTLAAGAGGGAPKGDAMAAGRAGASGAALAKGLGFASGLAFTPKGDVAAPPAAGAGVGALAANKDCVAGAGVGAKADTGAAGAGVKAGAAAAGTDAKAGAAAGSTLLTCPAGAPGWMTNAFDAGAGAAGFAAASPPPKGALGGPEGAPVSA